MRILQLERHSIAVVFVLSGIAALEMGCASTSPEAPFRDVARDVHARSGQKISWSTDTPEDAEAARMVEEPGRLRRPDTSVAAGGFID